MEIRPDSEWILCPFCGSKTRTKLLPTTVLRDFPLFCPKCKRTVIINAENAKVEVSSLLEGKVRL